VIDKRQGNEWVNPVMLTRPWHQGQGQGQGHGQNRTIKAYNADITLIGVQLFAFIQRLLPVLRLT